jgi:hypothetical protein
MDLGGGEIGGGGDEYREMGCNAGTCLKWIFSSGLLFVN